MHDVEALIEQGWRCHREGRFEEAAGCFARALAQCPDRADLHHAFGLALDGQSRAKEAEACFRRALELRPAFPEALNNLGHVLRQQDRPAEAERWHRRALAIDPGFSEASVHLGATLRVQGRLAEAAEVLRGAVAARPHLSEAWWHLGGVLREQCRFAEAAECQQRVLSLDPEHLGAHLQLAYILLTLGDLPAGSAAHEYRWGKGRNRRYPVEGKKLWNGESLPGDALLLWGELGFGDVLQFIRYAKLARRRVGRVLLHCHPALAVVMATVPGLDAVVPIGAPLPEFDAFLPVCSLMRVFGTTLDTIPADIPYLSADRDRVAALSPMLAGDGFKIGLVWSGNPRHGNDRRRSLPLAALAPILDLPGIRFFSLQTAAFTGEPDRRAAELRASRWASSVTDLAPALQDFADTAAALSQLDLVISVDTATAHLAGALGLPAWVLLPFNADWRWLRERDDSPWYPTLHLYRQDASFAWAPVIERVREDLLKHTGERGFGLR